MKSKLFLFLSCIITMIACEKIGEKDEILSDSEKLIGLKNVAFTYDSTECQINLPEGALDSGKTFEELYNENPDKYGNLENYSFSFLVHMLADNSKENATDSKFDGMTIKTILDTLNNSPIDGIASAFEILKTEKKPVKASSSFNLLTHKDVGKYIFRQTVDGNDLDAKFSPILNYKISQTSGTIPLPAFSKSIPTRASEETKVFLSQLLESDLLK